MRSGQDPHDPDAAIGWVLGTLPSEDAERYRRHLETCAECRAGVVRLQEVVDALAEAPAPGAPSAELRERTLRVAFEEASLSRAADVVDAPPARAPRRRRSPAVLAGLVVAVLLAGGLVTALAGRDSGPDRERAQQRTLVGSVTQDGGGPRARAAVVLEGGAAELVLTDLAGPPRGRVYQAWIVRPPAMPLPTGALFSVTRTGDTRVRLPKLDRAERVIVTAEPPRGSRVPSPPPLVTVLVPR